MLSLKSPNRHQKPKRGSWTTKLVWIIFLASLPLLSALGTQFYLSFKTSFVLLLLVFVLALVPLLVAFDKVPESLLALAAVTTALALLYSTSLSSAYLRGTDIRQEYYFANLVRTQSRWNSSIPDDYNAMLSVVIIPPVCSIVSGVPLIWVFQIVYPILFSFVPLALYLVFKEQTDAKTAFLSVFFFISVFTFYTEMTGLARQQIGEIFLSLILLMITSKSMAASLRKRAALFMVFGAMLVLSHYALALIFIGFASFALLVSIIREKGFQTWAFLARSLTSRKKLKNGPISSKVKRYATTVPIILLFSVFALGWFLSASGSAIFNIALTIATNIVTRLFTQFLNPRSAQGLFLLTSVRASVLNEATRLFHIVMQLFLTVGLFAVALGRVRNTFDREYVSFSLASFLLLVASIAVPFLSSSLNTTRVYHIALIFLAPFCLYGMLTFSTALASGVSRLVSRAKGSVSRSSVLKISSVVLSAFLLFNTGVPYYFANSDKSILNPDWAIEYGTPRDRLVLYNSYVPVEEVKAIEWLSKYRDSATPIYSDGAARGMISKDEVLRIGVTIGTIGMQSYVYLRELNVVDRLIQGRRTPEGVAATFNATSLISALSRRADMVYSGGESEVYYTISSFGFNNTT